MADTANYQITSLDERYTFIKPAGKGTYGTTWLAEDKTTGQKVAIKAISKASTTRSCFKKELKYGKHLSKHPHIISTHDTAYETKTSYVMVQDFARGGDLFDAIEPEVGLDEFKTRTYIYQIARALEFMHSKKLVHRDIKPENIVLSDEKGTSVKIIDFGMTLRTGTHVARVCRSIPYTPPEICNASDETGFFVEPSCDVWSMGVLLFCMLTGSFTWEQATLSNPNYYEFVQWQNGMAPKPPRMWQNFSPRLLQLFNRMLAMNPHERCEATEVYKYLNDQWFIAYTIPLSDSHARSTSSSATTSSPVSTTDTSSLQIRLYSDPQTSLDEHEHQTTTTPWKSRLLLQRKSTTRGCAGKMTLIHSNLGLNSPKIIPPIDSVSSGILSSLVTPNATKYHLTLFQYCP